MHARKEWEVSFAEKNERPVAGRSLFQVERREVAQTATQRMMSRKGVKVVFTDLLILEIAKTQGCSHTVSFDKGVVRSAGMVQLALA